MKTRNSKLLLTVFILTVPLFAISQYSAKIDSLEQELKKNLNDTIRIKLINDLAFRLHTTDPARSALLADEAIALSEKNKTQKYVASSYNVKAIARYMQSDYQKALEYWLKGLDYAHKNINEQQITDFNNNIGIVYYALNNADIAIEYYCKALEGYRKQKRMSYVSKTLANIANVYDLKEIYDTAIIYIDSAIVLTDLLEDKSGLGGFYNSKGNIFLGMQDTLLAIESYKKSLEIKRSENNTTGIANTAYNLGKLYIGLKKPDIALIYTLEAIKLYEGLNNYDFLSRCYNNMAFIEKLKGNYKKALEYYMLFFDMHDSVYRKDLNRQMAQMQTLYETEKKEQLIQKQNAELEKEKAENEARRLQQHQERMMLAGAALVILLLAIMAVVVWRNYRQKKKANILLQLQKEEIIQQKEEIISQRDEIEAQRDEITTHRDTLAKQKEHIEHIHEEQTSSIRYAQRIQEAMLPSLDVLEKSGLDHFLFFRPRDIVSGDFYWVTLQENLLVIAVADCTGHGVPGAFMSMLGIAFLKEIITKEYITQPDVILKKLRKEIIRSLKQEGGSQRDGMDIALCTLNLDTLELQFAGANNPLYIVHSRQSTVHSPQSAVNSPQSAVNNSQTTEDCRLKTEDWRLETGDWRLETEDSRLIEQKADKMPIGIHERMDNFTLHTMQLNKGDCIYLFSDGMADQFGGPNGKKLKYKPLKELLESNSNLVMQEQKEKLDDFFTAWKGALEQVDDVTLMGLKL